MNKTIVVVVALVLIGVLVALYAGRDTNEVVPENPLVVAENDEVTGVPTFAWRFTSATTTNGDGQSQTNVFLTASQGGKNTELFVDTVDGGCSEIADETQEGDISNTGKVQCYYAGLGQQYRITLREEIYLVERKLFEEATPDVEPTEYVWEVAAEFPTL